MSTLATSQIERHFITNEIYKRSKRYFDVIKLKSIQNLDSKLRRAPSSNQEGVQKKIQDSFMSSNQYFSKKRLNEIQKYKLKSISIQTFDNDRDQTETNCSVSTRYQSNKVVKKTFDMSKSLPREFYEIQIGQGIDLFDNFVHSDFAKPQKGKSIDFSKIIGRKNFTRNSTIKTKQFTTELSTESVSKEIAQNPQKQQNDQYDKTTKAYEKFYFDSSKFRCLIDVEKEKKAQQRKALRTNLENYEKKEISLEKIEKGRVMSQKNDTACNLMFYQGHGKEQSSSFHSRVLKKNENYWEERVNELKKEDFETVKRREEMIEKRLGQINARKHIPDVRGEICDAKYFMRNPN